MPDSKAASPNKKRSFDFDDIMSILGDDRPGTPAKAPAQEPAAVESPAAQVAQPVAAQQDNAIVDRLLADFAEKNAEILRLNNELTQIKYEVREKEQKISALTSIEAVLDQKEAALKEKDAILKEKEALLKEIEAALTTKDNEIKAYEAKVGEMEARMNEMAEQLGTLRKLSARESAHEPYVEPATSPGEKQEINVQEQMSAAEDDVASIFRRLAEAKVEEPESEEGKEQQPRRPRSAKLYDL
jgi:chromosome segregation ATPase